MSVSRRPQIQVFPCLSNLILLQWLSLVCAGAGHVGYIDKKTALGRWVENSPWGVWKMNTGIGGRNSGCQEAQVNLPWEKEAPFTSGRMCLAVSLHWPRLLMAWSWPVKDNRMPCTLRVKHNTALQINVPLPSLKRSKIKSVPLFLFLMGDGAKPHEEVIT